MDAAMTSCPKCGNNSLMCNCSVVVLGESYDASQFESVPIAQPTAPATPALSQIRQEIERLDKAATRGPWHWVRRDTDEACDYTKPEEGVVKGAEFEVFFNVSLRTQWEQPASIGGTLPEFIIDDEEEILRADAELIAYLRNNIASLLSIADMLEQRQLWQPIETAPKDGKHILTLCSRGVREAWWKEGILGDMSWGGEGWSYHESVMPTHWMPLPPALRSIAQMEEGV